jgi:hypothetical protein
MTTLTELGPAGFDRAGSFVEDAILAMFRFLRDFEFVVGELGGGHLDATVPVGALHRQRGAAIAESEAMPLRYAAEALGFSGDSEKAIRWLIALMVLCCDPLAITLTAAYVHQADSASRRGKGVSATLGNRGQA